MAQGSGRRAQSSELRVQALQAIVPSHRDDGLAQGTREREWVNGGGDERERQIYLASHS